MAEIKQVKVDNWGTYFLQRLKHFFNRTDYCDLTLQFQDNAQLKVHRLVLNACTEYFELLERTCEMYEDCLVMPDDLQADVVVPIVNFMYTGQLEFPMDLLEKLYQTSEIMNLNILTKLLDYHRTKYDPKALMPPKRTYKPTKPASKESAVKRSYTKAFDNKKKATNNITFMKEKKFFASCEKKNMGDSTMMYRLPSPIPSETGKLPINTVLADPRPTRYELPEELDTDNVFESSFSNISYTSQPLMVHPATRRQYSKKLRTEDSSIAKKYDASTIDIVQCKSVPKDDDIFEDSSDRINDDSEIFQQMIKIEPARDPSQLFDQILDQNDDANQSKVTIETTKSKKTTTANLDHAKIISEVLKKYPHLVKSNKNIKLKILNTPAKTSQKKQVKGLTYTDKGVTWIKEQSDADYTYETEVLNSKQAAKLVALGAENIEGPWICLICGTPGKALNFTSYHSYRRHLVEVHHEKPLLTLCEFCGQKLLKRNYMVHHMYTKHGREPPPQYNFPKCNQCDYIALTEALLVKHKISHTVFKSIRYLPASKSSLSIKATKSPDGKTLSLQCNVCPATFTTTSQLMNHVQSTGHKYNKQTKPNNQCVYCMRVFSRENNLYAHIKIQHKLEALRDGVIDDSDEEIPKEEKPVIRPVKCETVPNTYEEVDIQYQIQQQPDGNIHIIPKKQNDNATSSKCKILNPGFNTQSDKQKNETKQTPADAQNEFMKEVTPVANEPTEEIVMIDNNEYILKGNKLIPRKTKENVPEYIFPSIIETIDNNQSISTSIAYTNVQTTGTVESVQLKKSTNLNQPIPVYVSNEEEYKAIMTSNHPIIFDAADTNKTLTVLTAPHAGTLDTTAIDLDNNQSNDMMIIQDDYNTMNVTETVSTNNSNIVVVYSDQLDNQNKEYQLITTQGLQSQFVQSSAIITQNYETVTTTTPVVNAHVLDAQDEGVWQENQVIHQQLQDQSIEISHGEKHQAVIQEEQIQIPNSNGTKMTVTQLQQVIPDTTESARVVQLVQNSEGINQIVQILPNTSAADEVAEILPMDTVPDETSNTVPDHSISTADVNETMTESSQAENIIEGSAEESNTQVIPEINEQNELITLNDINNAHQNNEIDNSLPAVETSVEQQIDNVADIPVTSDIQAENSNGEATETISNKNSEHIPNQQTQVNESCPPNEIEMQCPENVEEHADTVVEHQEPETDAVPMEIGDPPEVQPQDVDDIHTAETQQIVEEETVEDTGFIMSNPRNEVVTQVIDPVEKIQSLTSEWSEEDSETASQDNAVEDRINAETSHEIQAEDEESIENIQQEVKHMIQSHEICKNNLLPSGEDQNLTNDNVEPGKCESSDTQTVTPTVKISSLLNDWEDNDSHDENDGNNVEKTNESSVTENNTPEASNVIAKDDNIKKLVSDWDDDEEDK